MSSGEDTHDLRSPGARAAGEGALAAGDLVGRYTIVAQLGAGGMGEVYAAHDPELDRDVAIKVLRPDVGGGSLRERTRFLREAQTLARLRHENVVTVHDAGTVGDQIFLAMERVAGEPLSRWLESARRSWREVRDVFLAAGRGLEAAHAVGIVHRDFKPHNVMVAPGRVVVLDFGLARRSDDVTDDPDEPRPAAPASLDLGVTATGDLLGTPPYLAPEQLRGEAATARSDQWSFCVALHEGLYGGRPFAGKDHAELFGKILAGLARPPSAPGVPRWLGTIVARGLALDPERRYPSMGALLADLGRDPARTRRRALALAGVLALAGGGVAARALAPAAPDPCAAAATALGSAWDGAARARLREGFAAVGRPFAVDAAARAAALLDAYAASWTAMRVEACQATFARGAQSQALLDLRMSCLDRRRGELAALVQALGASPDVATAQAAVESAARLVPVAVCADTRALGERAGLPDDPARRARTVELIDALAALEARAMTGKPQVIRDAQPLLDEARASSYAPLRARALLVASREKTLAHDLDGARALLEEAVEAAVEGQADDLAASAWLSLVRQRVDKGLFGEAVALELSARAAVTRSGSLVANRVDLDDTVGQALAEVGKLDEAAARVQRALATADNDVLRSRALYASMIVHQKRGDFEAWRKAANELLTVSERAYGAGDVRMGHAYMGLANLERNSYHLDEAVAGYQRALAIYEGSVGADSRFAGGVRVSLGQVEEARDRIPQALESYQAALAIWEKLLGPAHPELLIPLIGVGATELKLGQRAAGRAALLRAKEIAVKAVAPDSLLWVSLDLHLALLAETEGRREDAVSEARAGLEVMERRSPAKSANLVSPLRSVGYHLRMAGRPAEALPLLERSLALAGENDVGPILTAEVRWELAQALAAAHRDRPRARQLAAEAEAALRGERDGRAAMVAAWLARQPR